MSRPVGSEVIDFDGLQAAAERVWRREGRRGRPISQVAVATEAGISVSGLRDWLARRGLPWATFRDSLRYSAVKRESCPTCGGDDDHMRLLIPLPPEAADALLDLARAEKRHPRDTASLLLAAALRRRASRHPEPTPIQERRSRPPAA